LNQLIEIETMTQRSRSKLVHRLILQHAKLHIVVRKISGIGVR